MVAFRHGIISSLIGDSLASYDSSKSAATSYISLNITHMILTEYKLRNNYFKAISKHAMLEPESVHGLLEGCSGILRPNTAVTKVYTHIKSVSKLLISMF